MTAAEAHAQPYIGGSISLGWSERKSAMLYGVNRRTLRNRLNNRHLGPHGKQPKIPPQEEALAAFLLACSDTGIPLNRQHCAATIVDMNNRLAFNDQHFRRFLQRHPTLSIRVTHANNRKNDREWTHELADRYISKLTELLFQRGFLDEPEQVWNLDESAFNTAQMFDRVVGRKRMHQIYSQFDGTEKELVTILPCGNAAGLQLPFMALFSGKRHVRSRPDGTSGHCYQGVNDSGTMDQLHFANYLNDRVIPEKVAAEDYQPIFERLTESLSAEFDIVYQKDHGDILEFIRLKQRGVIPGAVLAASLQASLLTVAPKKARREKNDHLNLDAGGLTNEDNFQSAQAAKCAAVKAAKDASKAAKQKSKSNQEGVQETSSILHTAGKSVAVRKVNLKQKASSSHEPEDIAQEVPPRRTRVAKKQKIA
ncbi:hypothetical protein RvY_17356 [Ramazzottius varieornatus]|uniref:DDE-1 domain-containing protein n=1 Tax=Ramazzottius varieornatus TaxID=947166 RepID=A0A1D1W296_RAMVA|nr:hypothetical protein RvY_17356 [Ramazzottius varieornatus]